MAKKRRSARMIIGIVLIAIAVVLLMVQLFADRALKAGIEMGASRALKVAVEVSDVDLSVLGGSLGIKGLVINNPQGYQHKKLLELNRAKVKVDVASLMSDEIHIKQIKLDGMTLVIEQKGLTNNLKEIIDGLGRQDKPKTEEPEKQGKARQLIVDDLKITNVTVKVKMLPVPGRQDTFEMKLNPIEMKALGSDSKLDVAMLSSKILQAIAGGVAEQGVGILPDEVISPIKSGLKEVTQLGGVVIDEGKKVLEEGKDIGETLTEGIKNIFKLNKEKE